MQVFFFSSRSYRAVLTSSRCLCPGQTCAPGGLFLSSCWTGGGVSRNSIEVRWVPKEQIGTTRAITHIWYRAKPEHFAKAGSQVRTVWPLRPAKYCTIICKRNFIIAVYTHNNPAANLWRVRPRASVGQLTNSLLRQILPVSKSFKNISGTAAWVEEGS